MEQVKLVDLLWRGWNNQHLRALSHGSYVSLLVARKVNEAVFSQALLTIIREKKWDLDDLAHQFCKVQNIADPPKSHPTSEAVKVHKAQALAKFLGDQLESFASNMSSSSNPDKQEIESLRAQLEAEKARNIQSANSSQPAKRRRLLEKLPFVMKADIVERAVNPQHLGDRVLFHQNLAGHTKQAITGWIKTLKKPLGEDKHQELLKAIARAPEILKGLPEEHLELLRDKMCHLGCTVAMASKIKGPEIIGFACCHRS